MIMTNMKQAVWVGTLISTTLMGATSSVVCGFTSSNAFRPAITSSTNRFGLLQRRPLHYSGERQISTETTNVRRTTNMIGYSASQQTFYDTKRRRVLGGGFQDGILHMSKSSSSDDGSDTISAVESGDVQISQRDKDGNILLKEFEEEDASKETEPPTVGIPSANTTDPLPIEQTSREHFFPSTNSNNNSGDNNNDDEDHSFFDATKFIEDEEKQQERSTKSNVNHMNGSTSSNTKEEEEKEKDNNKISKNNDEESSIPASPHMSFRKFLTMQDKRVVVTICYSGGSNLRPYFLTAAKRIKHKFPDVLIEKLILPSNDEKSGDDSIFEVLVDGKVVIGRQRASRGGNVSSGSNGGKNVYVSLDRMEGAIVKARRRRRPSTVYETNVLAPAKGGKRVSISTPVASSDPKQAALRMDAWRRSKQQMQQQQQQKLE